MVVPLITELALLDAELGDPTAAARRIEDYLAQIGERGGPVTLGTLHEARAQIALLAGDVQGAREHLAYVKGWFLPTENPVLIARCERLQRQVTSGSFDVSARQTFDAGPSSIELLRAAMRDGVTAKERAAGVFDLLLKEAGGASGYLFGCDESELVLLCQRGANVRPRTYASAFARRSKALRAATTALRALQPAWCCPRRGRHRRATSA